MRVQSRFDPKVPRRMKGNGPAALALMLLAARKKLANEKKGKREAANTFPGE